MSSYFYRRSERDERRSSPERSERSRRDGDRPRRSRWGQTDEEVKRTDKSDTIGEDVSKMGGIGSKPEERESSGLIVPDIKSKEREISGGKETVNMFATESAVPAEPEGWD